MSAMITPITLPHPSFAPLAHSARAEGFAFLDRLVADWDSGANRFDRAGECLLGAHDAETLIAVAGLNIDPYANDPACARLRHVYVAPSHRRTGTGRQLVVALLRDAQPMFNRVRLRTTTPAAAAFYEALGFHTLNDPSATHTYTMLK